MPEAIEPQRWTSGRWWVLIGLILATQFGLIFWLGKPQPMAQAPAEPVPILSMQETGLARSGSNEELTGSSSAQMLALTDPTLLALPHRQGFSGPAWLTFAPQHFDSSEWSEPQSWLELPEGQLGSEFKDFMATNQFGPLPSWQQQDLELRLPAFEQPELLPARSRVWLAGGLAGRRLLTSPDLPSWPSSEILTNSVVQLVVDADGIPRSHSLLKSRGPPNEADDYAFHVAGKLRFEPLDVADPADPMAGLTWGQLVFEWRTVPLPATNNPAEPTLPK